jgi:hypothetical protein
MSDFKFIDDFEDLRHWSGTGATNTSLTFSGSTSVDAGNITTKNTFWDADKLSIRLYDNMGSFTMNIGIGGTNILSFSANGTNYTFTEGNVTTITSARSVNWHLLEIEIKENYRIFIDGTLVFTSDLPARRGFDINLIGGTWDNLIVEKTYEDEYIGGTGGKKDLQIQTLTVNNDGTVSYTLNPGYFYVDDLEYYYFGNMGVADIVPNPSGAYTFPSGLPYIPGEPYFIVDESDIAMESGYIRTPLNRDYEVIWNPATSGYQPMVSGAYDDKLVYEAGTERSLSMVEPITSTKLVITDEGGTAASVTSESAYVDYVTLGSTYETFAVVLDKYGGPVEDVTVSWKRIDSSDIISDLGSSTTNSKGVATKTVVITEGESFHIYAEINPNSKPRWIRVPATPAELRGVIFQMDNDEIYFDSMEARCAMGQNIWGDTWGTNPGEATGLGFPFPTTHAQWELENPEQERPPMNEVIATNETTGAWSAQDFNTIYPNVVIDGAGTLQPFMNNMRVARNGYWGPLLVSGADIRTDVTVASGQIVNHDDEYEIDRDYAVTSGTYLDVYTAVGAYDSVYYVFYQSGSEYVAGSYNPAGNFYFRGVALYDATLSQTNSRITDLLSSAELE